MKECVFLFPAEMPCWYYDKKNLKVTPSVQDGLPYDTERRYRKEGARFIMECGTAMSLGHNTMATGVVYFHRFYMFHSFKQFPRYVTACCCLFLAGKVEETPKKARDIIKTARNLLTDDKFFSFGDDPKEEVMTLERILLQTIKFDLQVEHPYGFLVKYAKCLKGDQGKLQKMVQMAWNFVNDSLSTTVCLQWEPEIIAVAMIHLASKLSKFTVIDWIGRQPNHLRWWDMFVADVTMEILEDICHQVLDLYQQTNNTLAPSPPQQPTSRMASPVNNITNNSTKRSMTPPSTSSQQQLPLNTSKISIVSTVPAVATIPILKSSSSIIDDKMLEGNPIPKLLSSAIEQIPQMQQQPPPQQPLPPPQQQAIQQQHYGYGPPANYGQMYQSHPAHYVTQQMGGAMGQTPAPPPPPPVPPIYGAQYPVVPPHQHYQQGPPQMGGHIPQQHSMQQQGHHPGYYPPQYGRSHYPPP